MTAFRDYAVWRSKGRKRFLYFLFLVPIVLVTGAAVMLLWNFIFPDLFNWNRIGYWQSVGLLVLCRILFGKRMPVYYDRTQKPSPHLREKWKSMSDEERMRFREEWKRRCETRK